MKTLAEIYDSLKQHFEAFEQSAREKAEQDLPVLADWVSKAAQNPVMDALYAAVHLPLAPEVLAKIAEEIRTIDAALGNAKQQAAAQALADAQAAAEAPAADPSAEPEPGTESAQ